MAPRATLTSKGQITIPQEVRRRLGLQRGDQIEFVTEDGVTVVRPVRGEANPFAAYVGALGAFGSKDELVRACAAAVFDTVPAVAKLRGIDPDLPLDERLAAGVAVMQQHVEQIVGLISVLHHAGVHPPMEPGRRKGSSDPAVDAAFTDLIGADAASLRKPVDEVIGLLQLLTLSSVHPLMSTRRLDAAEIVDVVLDGTRRKS